MENNEAKRLFVGGFPWKTRWQELKEIFGQFGEVSYAKVIIDQKTKKSKGYGFVEFVNYDDAVKAKEQMDGSEIEGRTIKVEFAMGKKEEESQND